MFKTTSVGISILENLEALYQFCTRNSFPVFCQNTVNYSLGKSIPDEITTKGRVISHRMW